jgi:nitrite reductase/ring-hydroxylating ferredoxin subunit
VSLFERIRLRVLAIVLAVVVTGVALVAFTTLPTWPVLGPVIGATIAAFAVAVNTVGSRLAKNVCLHCGEKLSITHVGEHGVTCPCCGSLSFPGEPGVAREAPADEDETATDSSESATSAE